MEIVNFLVVISFLYLLIYSIYLLTLNIKSFTSNNFLKELKEKQNHYYARNKLCVIVWADKNQDVSQILDSLSLQTYPREYYDIHVVCIRDPKALKKLPDFVNGAVIHAIENPSYFSKDKALSLFTEKIIKESDFDAFVFLNANRIVGQTYLENVNKALSTGSVLTGKLSVIKEDGDSFNKFISNVLSVKQEFTNATLNLSRRMFELVTTLDGDNCIIKTNTLEKIGRVCFETKNDELKYSLFLASNEIKPVYCPFVETFVNVHNYNASSPLFTQKVFLLKYYLPLLYKKRWYFVEYVLSILRPNALFATILYLAMLYCTFRFMLSIDIKYVFHLGLFLLFNVLLGAISSKINFLSWFYLPFYPICCFILKYKSITKNLTLKRIESQEREDAGIDVATVKGFVSDGNKNLSCEIDLVSEDGMRKAVFRYKKKKLFSDSCIRMCDAIDNISKRLNDKGFLLRICNNCANFTVEADGSIDLIKGFCILNKTQDGSPEKTLIWNTCTGFVPRKKMPNVLDGLKKNRW